MALPTDQDLARLRRAIAIAAKGRFAVDPNPRVGCVLAREGRVVGEGWHLAYGGPHAEVVALRQAGEAARGATAYVTLEPCSRTSKTGPCTDALIAAGVSRVLYAATDPNEAGAGHARLREAGLEVAGPLLPGEGAPLLDAFLAARGRRRPWVVAKWAMTLDGRVASARGVGGRITGERADAWVHDLRAHCDAVAVGVETVLADDPRLTCRLPAGLPHGRPQPARVVFDSRLRTPREARLVADLGAAPVWVLTTEPVGPARVPLEARGVEVVVLPGRDGRVDPVAALDVLGERGVGRLLVEGGPRLHGALLGAGLVDQVAALVAPRLLGRADAPAAVEGAPFANLEAGPRLRATTWRRLGEDLLLQGYVPR